MTSRPVIAALAVCHRDVELSANWLRWVNFLTRNCDMSAEKMLIVHTKRAAPHASTLTAHLVGTYYGEFATTIVECPDERETGYPGAASHLFLRTLEIAEKRFPGHSVLWCEPDTVPMKPEWFAEIRDEYQTCGKPFLGMLVGTRHPHLSGVSIYPHNWRQLAPSIADVLNAPDVTLWGPGKGQPWDVFCRHETTPQMAESKLMMQVWKDRGSTVTRLRQIPERICLFHQDKTGALIREIAAARYPEFMEQTAQDRKYFVLNGHPSRLVTKGLKVNFTYSKHKNHSWISAVCSDEINPADAQTMTMLCGTLGLRTVEASEFERITGRKISSIRVRPQPRSGPRSAPTPAARAPSATATHPSVFVMLGRFGDICNLLPLLKAEADAGRRPTLVVAQEFASILDGVSYCDRIVWEGLFNQLPEALRWLRKSHGIIAPVIAQVHRNPLDKARLTPSYQVEAWRLAGRFDEFATRGPLVFDRRDEAREKAYSALPLSHLAGDPLVLVALDSVSSPIDGKPILDALVALNKSFVLFDFGGHRAERVYDMIGLLDQAALLISVDTMHLHLARASKVPVIAILNDGWNGSIPPANTLASFRYAEVKRNPEVVAKLAQTFLSGKKTPPRPAVIAEPNQATPRDIHVVDAFGKDERTLRAQASWQPLYADGLHAAKHFPFERDARSHLNDPRPLPYLKDILARGLSESQHAYDIIIFTNDDIALPPGAHRSIRAYMDNNGGIGAISMRRTESNGEHHIGRDLFAFKAGWLRHNWDVIPDYVIGAPAFDLGMVALIRKMTEGTSDRVTTLANIGKDWEPADMPPGLALHESHKSAWHVPNHHTHASVLHNKRQFFEWSKKHAPEIKFTPGGNLK